jgi:hypothetical protein
VAQWSTEYVLRDCGYAALRPGFLSIQNTDKLVRTLGLLSVLECYALLNWGQTTLRQAVPGSYTAGVMATSYVDFSL